MAGRSRVREYQLCSWSDVSACPGFLRCCVLQIQVTVVKVVQVVGPNKCFLNFENFEGIRKNTVARAADALKKYAQPIPPSVQTWAKTQRHRDTNELN